METQQDEVVATHVEYAPLNAPQIAEGLSIGVAAVGVPAQPDVELTKYTGDNNGSNE